MRATYRLDGACGKDLLSARVRAVCFVRVSPTRTSLGVRIACIALAGTVGAMGTLGYRRGGAADPFASGGYLLVAGAPRSAAIVVGALVHVIWIVAWSMLAAALMQRRVSTSGWMPAVLTAALAFGASVVAPAMIVGPLGTFPLAERAVVHLTLAVSFIIGMRLAPAGDGPNVRRVSNGEGWPLAG
jgi:hypothetical protein